MPSSSMLWDQETETTRREYERRNRLELLDADTWRAEPARQWIEYLEMADRIEAKRVAGDLDPETMTAVSALLDAKLAGVQTALKIAEFVIGEAAADDWFDQATKPPPKFGDSRDFGAGD